MNRQEFQIFVLSWLAIILGATLLFGVPLYVTRLNDNRFNGFLNECYSGNKASCMKAAALCDNSGREALLHFQLIQKANSKD